MSTEGIAGTVFILFVLIVAIAANHCNDQSNKIIGECLKTDRSASDCRFMIGGQR